MNKEVRLSDLPPGGRGRIIRVSGSSVFKKRLLEMGVVRGELVEKIKLAPLADPAEYVVKGYHVSLRQQEARDVMVEVL